ncbi:MAG: hypothetical protein LC676_17130 [Loktanella sp.]|nr:hypothetical protein [Loktanella sp.]
MRSAAGTLGLIGGLIGIIVGLFGYGSATLIERNADLLAALDFWDNPGFIKFASFIAPLLAIGGGAMARDRALIGGVLMLLSALAFYAAFGINLGTLFPIGFAAAGGILAIISRQPDTPRAH